MVCATFFHIAGFFEWSCHLHIYTSKCLSFLTFQSHVFTAFILEHSHLYFWYVYIFFSLLFKFFQFCYVSKFLVSHFIHIISVPKN